MGSRQGSQVDQNVRRLLETYTDEPERPVRYRPRSWTESEDPDYSLLHDPKLTRPTRCDPRDRLVHRETLEKYAARVPTTDEEALRQLFVLVMVWGSGTSNTRSYRYTRDALADPRLDTALRVTAEACREPGITRLEDAYRAWRVTGVRRSYFTKWFRFAGYVPDRSWQPLILDDRVLNSLNATLNLSTHDLAGSNRWATRYRAYVELVHEWADDLEGITAQRIEWVLFMHNGRALSDTSTTR